MFGSILSGISGIGSGIAGYFGQKSANKANVQMNRETNEMNKYLAAQGREHDVNMWNMQNEYNTPEMQMQRLKEAGLNPNLIYEGGAGSMGNAGAVSKGEVAKMAPAHVQNQMASIQAMNLMPAISMYQDWQVKKAQIDNLKAQRENITEQTIGNRINNYIKGFDKEHAQISALNRAQKLLYDTGHSKENLRLSSIKGHYATQLSELQLEALKYQNRQRQLDIALDEELKPFGMHKGDELWQRVLMPVLLNSLNVGDIRQHSAKSLMQKLGSNIRSYIFK